MKNIGMIVACEVQAVADHWGAQLEQTTSHGWEVYVLRQPDKTIYIVHSHVGEIAAAGATQMLISDFGVSLVVNYGVVGALRDDLNLAEPVVVERVVHYDMDTTAVDHTRPGRYLEYPDIFIPTTPSLVAKTVELFPDIQKVTDASGDKFIADPDQKKKLAQDFEADICEMEAAGIVMTCNRCQVPCLLIKTISDSLSGGADEYWKQVNHAADVCLEVMNAVLDTL